MAPRRRGRSTRSASASGRPPTSGPRSPARSPRPKAQRGARAGGARRAPRPTIESSGAGSSRPSGPRPRRASGCARRTTGRARPRSAAMEARLNLESLREQVAGRARRDRARSGSRHLRASGSSSGDGTGADGGRVAASRAAGRRRGRRRGRARPRSGEGARSSRARARGPGLGVRPPPASRRRPAGSADAAPAVPRARGRQPVRGRRVRGGPRRGSRRSRRRQRDLRDAIARTRSLIADLDELIATQFRTTFAGARGRVRRPVPAAVRRRVRPARR